MAATTWSQTTQYDRREWLLANGEILAEPDLEVSGSGRKMRVVGSKESFWTTAVDDAMVRVARLAAREQGTKVWMPLTRQKEEFVSALGYDPAATPAKLHLLHEPGVYRAQTSLWWKFKHPDLPIVAYLSVVVEAAYGRGSGVSPQVVTRRLIAPATHVGQSTYHTEVLEIQMAGLDNYGFYLNSYDERLEYEKWVKANPPTWDTSLLGSDRYDGERPAVAALLKLVHELEDLDSIQIPDLRDTANPAWMTLELIDSNVNATLVSDLAEYLDGTPSIEEAVRLYKELQKVLQKVGVVMDDASENDFQSALLTDYKKALTVGLSAPVEVGHQLDHYHRLSLHLPSGTFVVHCQHNADSDEIAEKWEEAKLIASLSGEEDVLLAYARRYAEKQEAKRTKQILKERRADS